ncbi:site-specific tyrosine recombinase/integron integrase [Fictibacillus sp. KU28468]|uniref:site-specific tyrosine recombinase/integron integrase n=1 Tax=Fictibacillus sp. KU28468 TaxID=2991053 RepID=UPI00223CEFC6|nr:site-specific tyrosine recombinase/integron integrase [Fictibacillus sp. KU28468]UZJ79570.1 tyrosine-type recombinase/integrase [Fictibacillus sp. KU28468]
MEPYWKLTMDLPNKENQKGVENFLMHLKLANRSDVTIINYRRSLENFFRDMEDAYSSISSEQILDWLQKNKSHLKKTSYKSVLAVLSSFYSFCVQESLMEKSPIKRRWFPRLPQSLPKYLEKDEVAKVRQVSEQLSIRDQFIVEFLLSSGCRVGELHRLNLEDVDLENRTARVLGKGKKIRSIHFSERCAVLLEKYLGTRHILNFSSPLIVTRWTGQRLSINGLQTMLTRLGRKAGLDSNLHPHRYRHTFATELLSKGAELSFISDELGHASLSTTQIYARIPNHLILLLYRKFMG